MGGVGREAWGVGGAISHSKTKGRRLVETAADNLQDYLSSQEAGIAGCY